MRKRTSVAATAERQQPMLFDAEQIGRTLREVAVDVIETEGSTILSRWFHSKHDVELFLWLDGDQNVIKYQVTFFGQVVEWNVFEGVKTGYIIEEEVAGHGDENVKETIEFDQTPQDSAIERAIRLLEHVPDLPGPHREKICSNLRLRVRGEPDSQDAFIRRYGEVYGKSSKGRGFWKRLKRWFSGS
jgi:hypothetical protein